MIRSQFLFSILIIFFAFLTSCEKDQPRLSRSHKQLVDSLVQEQKPAIREKLDSICDTRFEKEIKLAMDSIVQDRMLEIKRKIEADAKN